LSKSGYGGTTNPGAGGGMPATGGASPGTGGMGGTIEPGPVTGVWEGYAENYHFCDGSDALRMTLYSVSNGVQGQIEFGDSPPLPPPTDPNVGYPPGMSGGMGGGSLQGPAPGFQYTMIDASFDGVRLRFGVASREIYKAWCEMQTPIFDEVNGAGWGCLPNWGGGGGDGKCFMDNPETNEKVYVDCGKMQLCMWEHACSCTAQGCTAEMGAGVQFDMQLHPPAGNGSVAGLDGSLHTVYFTKQ